MTKEHLNSLATAYKYTKRVLDEVSNSERVHTVLELSAAVGILESICLKEMKVPIPMSDKDRADFLAAAWPASHPKKTRT